MFLNTEVIVAQIVTTISTSLHHFHYQ